MTHYDHVWQNHAIDDLTFERSRLILVQESGAPTTSQPPLDLDQGPITLLGSPHFDWENLSGSPDRTGTLSAISSVLINTSSPNLGNDSASIGASGTVSLGNTNTYATPPQSVELTGSMPEFTTGSITIDSYYPPSVIITGSLSGNTPQPSTDDFPANTNTTGTVMLGSSVTGEIESDGDQDWFRISLTAGRVYTFDLQGADSSQGTLVNPNLYLMDSTGVFNLISDHDSGTGYDAHLVYGAPISGDYYLGAHGDYTGTGTYTLAVADIGGDDYADNSSTTGMLTLSEAVTGNIQFSGDQDWFSIDLIAGMVYAFEVVAVDSTGGGPLNPYLYMWNSTSNLLATNYSNSGSQHPHLVFCPVESGTYYLDTLGNYTSTGSYTLFASELGTDDFAGNSTTTGMLAAGDTLTGMIQFSGDQDWVRIELSAGRIYTFELKGVASTDGALSNPRLQLMDAAANVVTQYYSYGIEYTDALITYVPDNSGIYYLSSASGFYNSIGAYSLAANDMGSDDFADDSTTTGTLAVGETVSGNIQFSGDQDWFRIDLTEGRIYAFELMGIDTTGSEARYHSYPPKLQLLDSAESTVLSISGFGTGFNERLVYSPTNSGTYFISAGQFTFECTSDIALTAQSYSLSATYIGADDFAGSRDTTGTLAVGETVSGDIQFNGDQDWFRIDLIAGHLYDIGVQSVDIEGDVPHFFYLNLLDDAAVSIASTSSIFGPSNAHINVSPARSGTYYLSAQVSFIPSVTYTLEATEIGVDDHVGDATNNTLTGGLGINTYWVYHPGDRVIETSTLANEIDSVFASLSWTLGANLEQLALLGNHGYSGSGNVLDNTLTGNAAGNLLNGGSGADTLIGGDGNDTYVVDNAGDTIQETGADTGDSVRSWVDWTLSDNLENLTLHGTKPLNGSGNSLNNSLTGNGSANILNGGAGNDILNGASGNDTLTGGSGADTFAFTTPLNPLRNVDTLTDFASGTDKINLSHGIFSQIGFTGSPGNDAFFYAGSTAHDANDRILYDPSTGVLSYDADGTGALAALPFALMQTLPTLVYSDFYIV